MSRRRIRVSGIDAVATILIAVLAGLWIAEAGPSPTGSTVIDAILVFVFSVAVVFAAASAPWWAGVVVAAVGAAFVPSWPALVLAVLAMAGGLAVGLAKRSLPWSRALVAGAALQALTRLGNVGFFGLSSIVGVGMSVMLLIVGIRRRPSTERKWMWATLGGMAVVVFLSLVGLAVATGSARPELENGNRVARQGISELASGDLAGAKKSFANASIIFGHADDSFSAAWAQPSRLLPMVAQNRAAVSALLSGASKSMHDITAALDEIDLDALRPHNGQLNIDVVRKLVVPIGGLNTALDELDHAVRGVSGSGWVIGPITSRVSALRADIAKQQVRGANALAVVKAAPAMLGGDGKRVYFVSFLTPAEARGGGGLMGNYAELTIDNGKFSLTKFGRHTDLNQAGDLATRSIPAPANWLNHWGPYGLIRDDGFATYSVWSNVTMSPNFPDTAEVMSELYPQSGGTKVDGVFSLDVFALAKLLDIVGPVQVDGLSEPLTSANVVQYLLKDQYLGADSDNANRIDTLSEVAKASVDKLFNSDLPSPPQLAALFAPLASEGHLKAWAVRPDEEQVFERANMSGALPALNGGDGFTFALTNGAGNKIDAYLEGDSSYVVATNKNTGQVNTTATLILRNTAPASGLSDYVIGNFVHLPKGYSNTFVSIYSALTPVAMTVDDAPGNMSVNTDDAYNVAGTYVKIPPGGSVKVTVTFQGNLDLSHGYHVDVRSPTLAIPIPIRVNIDGKDVSTITDSGTTVVSAAR
ncbi:MAG: hypothetical protein JWM34_1177 [Ilumatobacteraceae bacterium]|nr:hypothetical protein [Ilumatobacteraceae bacterium]